MAETVFEETMTEDLQTGKDVSPKIQKSIELKRAVK